MLTGKETSNPKAKVAKPDKKKQPAKKPKAKGLAILFEVELSEAEQLKLATKRSKTQFHSSHASGSGDGVNTQSKVPDKQQQKTSGTDEGTSAIPGVPDVPIYEFESEKESWGDSEDEDDKNDYNDLSDEGDDDNDGNDGNEGDDDDANDDDKQEEEEEYDDEFNIEEDEKMDEEEDDEVTKELYKDVNINLGNKDADMTDADQGPTQSSSISSDFTSKLLLNLDNPSPADNEIASLMDTTTQHATTIPETTSSFTTTVPPPHPFFNPLQQEATPTPTPTTSETTTSIPTLPDFAYVFKFNERVTNLEKDLSKTKQVDQYAQALSSIPDIVDQEAQAEKREYIKLVDSMVKTIIKDEVNAQLHQILPQAFSDVATLVIKKNVTESVEAVVLTRSSSQPTSTYKATATLSEFELTKILINKMEKNKSYDKADYKKKLYDALVESYNTDKDLFDSYGEDKKSLSTSKKASKSQHKSFGKFAHAEEPSHTIKDLGMQQDQEFVMRDNDEQPADKEVTKADWFKKPEGPPTPNPDWSKRQQVEFRPPQTWNSQVARAKEPPTSFDELNDTSFDFSAFVMNQLKIINLTQEILVGLAFNLLKGTCKSITEVEYHLEECSKATTERLDG
ncbi:hypothetical protein Tco_0627463 [Tanacetum coccineum]|uniref:Uncharacterized protein n=1 Tax=Tanacetum coccineum TaxID=301880 RepID=A0ABQ4WMH9_9ASTR